MRRLCGEGSRSYLGRSRLVPERATVMSRSEKSAKAVVVEAGTPPRKRDEGPNERDSHETQGLARQSIRCRRGPGARGSEAVKPPRRP